MLSSLSLLLLAGLALSGCATSESQTSNPKAELSDPVADALAEYAQHIDEVRSKIKPGKQSLTDELKLRFELDQYIRNFFVQAPFERHFTPDQLQAFRNGTNPKFSEVDRDNTARLKVILKDEGGWLVISKYGRELDRIAWFLTQHADLDHPFQKDVLALLTPLVARGETDPSHYALLHDRVSVADHRPQLYGTQGQCTGPGTWEPATVLGAIADVDKRRAEVGLPPMAEYMLVFKEICHGRDG